VNLEKRDEDTYMINKRRFAGVLCVLLGAATIAVAKEKVLVNADASGLILHGYDPVAYFTKNEAVKGNEQHKATYQGGTFYFASEANKNLFKKDPAKYAPQYGGYCSVTVSMGKLEDADPRMFNIHNDKLLVQRNEKAHQMFMSNPDEFQRKADQQWPELVEKYGK
jgi:YHS domain-containing protein